MQDFENIQSLWQSHSVESKLSSEQMLEQAKKDLNIIRTRSFLNIGGMVISLIIFSAALLYFQFDSWTTNLGIGIIVLIVAIYTILLYREHRLIAKNDFTVRPKEFLDHLYAYQISRFNLYNKLYWIYVIGISIGFILFFLETLRNLDTPIQFIIIIFTIIWMVFCATVLRKAFMKKERERIDLLIEKFERIGAQFKDPL